MERAWCNDCGSGIWITIVGSDMTNLKAGRLSNVTKSQLRGTHRELIQDEQASSISKTFPVLRWRIG